eukprot:Skav224252  [mRNA]  locus=scaffold2636:14703:15730:- [translate_table: standard]
MASEMVFTAGFTSSATPAKLLVPGSSPVAPSHSNVTRAILYFRLSPTIITFESAGAAFLIASSTGTGAIFSPPAPMINSLYRPVILTTPLVSM